MTHYRTTVQFRDRNDHNKLKVAAAINNIPIGELLDRMVDQGLKQFTKAEVMLALSYKASPQRLSDAW